MNFGLLRVNHRTSKFCTEPALWSCMDHRAACWFIRVTSKRLLHTCSVTGTSEDWIHTSEGDGEQLCPRCCQAWRRRHCLEGVLYEGLWDFLGGPVAVTPCSQCRGPGSIPGKGTFQIRSHKPQLRVCTPQPEILCARTKARYSQINRHVI